MPIPVFVNPAARRGRGADRVIHAVRSTLSARGIEADIVRPDGHQDLSRAIADRIETGADRVLIVGGDGMIHRSLPSLANTGATVGFIPAGTGNDFTRALGLPTDPVRATEAALQDPTPIDLLRVGQRWVASALACGFAGDVNTAAESLGAAGSARYTVATLAQLPKLQSRSLRLSIDGTVHQHQAALVVVANTAYFGGGMKICPDATPTDGQAQVLVVEDVSRLRLARFFPMVFWGRHVNLPEVTVRTGRNIELDIAGSIWADGEAMPAAPLTVEVVPGALAVAGVGGLSPSAPT